MIVVVYVKGYRAKIKKLLSKYKNPNNFCFETLPGWVYYFKNNIIRVGPVNQIKKDYPRAIFINPALYEEV